MTQPPPVELLPCPECGMPCSANEYHPYAACLMFKQCHNSRTVKANVAAVLEHGKTQPAAIQLGESDTPPAEPAVAFPARYFCSGPQGWFWIDDLELGRDIVNAYDKDGDWTITAIDAMRNLINRSLQI